MKENENFSLKGMCFKEGQSPLAKLEVKDHGSGSNWKAFLGKSQKAGKELTRSIAGRGGGKGIKTTSSSTRRGLDWGFSDSGMSGGSFAGTNALVGHINEYMTPTELSKDASGTEYSGR
jgi:hypothetical protein